MGLIVSAQNSNGDIARRIITAYIQEDVWYCSFEVEEDEPDITEQDTLDISVYNPRAWQRDSVPGNVDIWFHIKKNNLGMVGRLHG